MPNFSAASGLQVNTMIFYTIKERLIPAGTAAISGTDPYVALFTSYEWQEEGASLGLETDVPVSYEPLITKAEVGAETLTGSFSLLSRSDLSMPRQEFAFVLDERSIAFVDDSGFVSAAVEKLRVSRRWRSPSLSRFLYDFLELIISGDMALIQELEDGLEELEEQILADDLENVLGRLNVARGDLLDIRTEYDQLTDLGIELEENENGFFDEEGMRLFRLFTSRVERYRDQVLSLRDYTSQIRDLYQSRIAEKQNKTMNLLTVITTLFFPLSIITGWYGMNFVHMPELKFPWAYFALIGICAVIVTVELIIFKKKKLL